MGMQEVAGGATVAVIASSTSCMEGCNTRNKRSETPTRSVSSE